MIIQTEQHTTDLLARIEKIEQDLYARRHLISVRSTALVGKTRKRMRYSLTSPVMLLAAAGTGFFAQRWVKRNFSRTPEEIELRRKRRIARHEEKLARRRRKSATGESSGILGRGLKLIAMVRALIAALPSSWVNALPVMAHSKAAAAQPIVTPVATPYDSTGTQAR